MPGRPPSDSAETFDRIVGTAKRLLVSDGAGRLSLRRVAAESGLSLGTVQYYFRSKDKLLATCLEEHDERIADHFQQAEQAIERGTPIDEVVARGVRAIYRHGTTEPELHRLRLLRGLNAGDVEQRFLLRELNGMAQLFVSHVGMAPVEARLVVQTIAMTLARYVAFDADDLRRISGAADVDAARDAVEEHLASFSRALLSRQSRRALGR